MSDTAFQKQYRQEFIAGFEFGQSMLRSTVVTESVVKGNEATFLVADTGGAEAVTRGVNGMIPARADNLTQKPAILTEWHDKPRRTRFNIFGSQGDGRRIMQQGTIKVMNRKIDDVILANLNTATQTINVTGSAADSRMVAVTKAIAVLGNNDVDVEEESNMFGVMSPAFRAFLYQNNQFTSADYVDVKPFNGPVRKMLRWAGVNWVVHSRVPGVGTANEHLFVYHRNSIGHAVNSGDMDVKSGYNEEDDYYWARTSMFMGGSLLQPNGVVVVNHDGSSMVADA